MIKYHLDKVHPHQFQDKNLRVRGNKYLPEELKLLNQSQICYWLFTGHSAAPGIIRGNIS